MKYKFSLRFLAIIFFFALCLTLTFPTFAAGTEESLEELNADSSITTTQEEEIQVDDMTKTVSGKYFDLKLERRFQNPLNKRISYLLTVTPRISSPETQIIWNTPSVFEVTPKHDEFTNLVEDETYEFKATLKPLRPGVYDFSVSVISWQYDTNYTNSIGDTVNLNNSLVSQPRTQGYLLTSIILWVLGIAFCVAIVYFVIKLTKVYTQKAKKWLTPPS